MTSRETLKRQSGFTLIELMIVVVVVAILASIAYPLYSGYLERARRTDGQSMLMQVAGHLERCYTVNSSYQNCISALASGGMASEDGHYTVTATSLSASTFTLSAAPKGAQAADSCGNLTLNQRGERTPDDCW
ncbi:type IV pilin protein [Litchfieldella anticariensis]|nr:type IV pilin protein [Halomonas anticariensis]